MAGKNSIGLDTTVILRLLTGEPEKQFEKAKEFIESQLAQHKELFVSDLVIAESYFALHHHYEIPKIEVVKYLDNLLSSGLIHVAPGSVCKDVLKESFQHKAGFVDQLIYEQYFTFADQIVSFDKSMAKLEGVIAL